MKNEGKRILKGAMLSGVITAFIPVGANANDNLLDYDFIGTGSELRGELLNKYGSATDVNTPQDFILGETKCGEGKCGEGKCGEKAEKKSSKSGEEVKKAEAKSDKKMKKKKKAEKGKTAEAKCGENTCGGK